MEAQAAIERCFDMTKEQSQNMKGLSPMRNQKVIRRNRSTVVRITRSIQNVVGIIVTDDEQTRTSVGSTVLAKQVRCDGPT